MREHKGFEDNLEDHVRKLSTLCGKFMDLKEMCHPSDEGYYEKLITIFNGLESNTYQLLETFRGSVMEEYEKK